MRATPSILDNNRVNLVIEVGEDEIAEAIDATATQLARELSVKGFRKGKAPKQVIEARLGGAAALRAQAINSSLGNFYAKAVSESLIDPIGEPELKITSGEESGELVFEVDVDVRPEVDVVGYRELRVTIPSPIVTDDDLERQIDRIRETDSELREVDRPIVNGDIIVIDVHAEEPGAVAEPVDLEDFSYTVGSGSLAGGIDETIVGLRAGEQLEAMGRRQAGVFLKYDISIKKVSERVLPDLSDEWVDENTEYATVEALREGILTQLRRMKLVEAKFAQRDAALGALSDLLPEDVVPESLLASELEYRVQDLSQRLEQQGLSFEYLLQATNQSPEDLVASLKGESNRAVRVDLALRALARNEHLEPDQDAIDEELATTATAMKVSAEQLWSNLHDNGRTYSFISEIAKLNASRWLMEHVIYVDEHGAEIDRSLLETPSVDDSSSDEPSA